MRHLIVIMLFLNFSLLYAQKLNVAVFYKEKVTSCLVSVYIGKYNVFADTTSIATLSINETWQLTYNNDSIEIRSIDKKFGKYKKIRFQGIEMNNVLKYKPIIPSLNQRYYDDDMEIKAENNSLVFNNFVDIEDYVCGVVESETGYQPSIEFYKTQAVLCRTFAFENIGKHYTEGFHLCDGVHCQVYKGKNYSLSYHSIISQAVNDTKDMVIVDSSGTVITAAFHANCGGQTMNSEDVWGKPKYYLRSVNDPYCQYQRNSAWEKKISIADFKKFLSENKISVDNLTAEDFNFSQTQRKAFYKIKNDNISLRKIRENFNLKSTYFSVKADGDSLIFTGKGMGHGVGLCQDGAMQMAKKGFSYSDIINFYYKGVRIVSYKSLPFYQSILGE
ncbi:MAG: SpoIID/LytB domain-containing protein [Bacteroidales bacterium]